MIVQARKANFMGISNACYYTVQEKTVAKINNNVIRVMLRLFPWKSSNMIIRRDLVQI